MQPHTAHKTQLVADVSLGMYKPSTLLFGLLKPCLGSHWFHNSEEVEMAVCEWMHMQEPICYGDWIFLTLSKMGEVHQYAVGLC